MNFRLEALLKIQYRQFDNRKFALNAMQISDYIQKLALQAIYHHQQQHHHRFSLGDGYVILLIRLYYYIFS